MPALLLCEEADGKELPIDIGHALILPLLPGVGALDGADRELISLPTNDDIHASASLCQRLLIRRLPAKAGKERLKGFIPTEPDALRYWGEAGHQLRRDRGRKQGLRQGTHLEIDAPLAGCIPLKAPAGVEGKAGRGILPDGYLTGMAVEGETHGVSGVPRLCLRPRLFLALQFREGILQTSLAGIAIEIIIMLAPSPVHAHCSRLSASCEARPSGD